MNRTTVQSQISFARELGIPKAKTDLFIALLRKRPVSSVLDLEAILRKMALNTRNIDRALNAYIMTRVAAPSITTTTTAKSASRSGRAASKAMALSNTASSAQKSSGSKRRLEAPSQARSISKKSRASTDIISIGNNASGRPLAATPTTPSGSSPPKKKAHAVVLKHILGKNIIHEKLNGRHILKVGNRSYSPLNRTGNLFTQVPEKLFKPLGSVLLVDAFHPSAKKRGKITNMNSLLDIATKDGKVAKMIADELKIKVPKTLKQVHREKIHQGAMHYIRHGHIPEDLVQKEKKTSTAKDPFKRLLTERQQLYKMYLNNPSDALINQIEEKSTQMKKLLDPLRAKERQLETEYNNIIKKARIITTHGENLDESRLSENQLQRARVLHKELDKIGAEMEKKWSRLTELDNKLYKISNNYHGMIKNIMDQQKLGAAAFQGIPIAPESEPSAISHRSIGSKNTASSRSISSRNTGSRSIGSRDTGSRSIGSRNTGSRSIGSRNTGSRSIGSRNTGSRSTGSSARRSIA